MVIAIMMESDMKLSDDLVEAIIDNVSSKQLCRSECHSFIYRLVILSSLGRIYIGLAASFILCCRHLLMLTLTRMVESIKKNGRLLCFDILPF